MNSLLLRGQLVPSIHKEQNSLSMKCNVILNLLSPLWDWLRHSSASGTILFVTIRSLEFVMSKTRDWGDCYDTVMALTVLFGASSWVYLCWAMYSASLAIINTSATARGHHKQTFVWYLCLGKYWYQTVLITKPYVNLDWDEEQKSLYNLALASFIGAPKLTLIRFPVLYDNDNSCNVKLVIGLDTSRVHVFLFIWDFSLGCEYQRWRIIVEATATMFTVKYELLVLQLDRAIYKWDSSVAGVPLRPATGILPINMK